MLYIPSIQYFINSFLSIFFFLSTFHPFSSTFLFFSSFVTSTDLLEFTFGPSFVSILFLIIFSWLDNDFGTLVLNPVVFSFVKGSLVSFESNGELIIWPPLKV
eukprot:UN14452